MDRRIEYKTTSAPTMLTFTPAYQARRRLCAIDLARRSNRPAFRICVDRRAARALPPVVVIRNQDPTLIGPMRLVGLETQRGFHG